MTVVSSEDCVLHRECTWVGIREQKLNPAAHAVEEARVGAQKKLARQSRNPGFGLEAFRSSASSASSRLRGAVAWLIEGGGGGGYLDSAATAAVADGDPIVGRKEGRMFSFNKLDGRVANMEKAGSKSPEKEKLSLKVKKIHRKASPRLCFWISVFSILFIILACPGLDPLEGKYETLRYAASLERDSFDMCSGRRVYMYDLPPEFNIAVHAESRCNMSLMGWINLCPRFTNDGYGAKLWNDSYLVGGAKGDFDMVDWHHTDSYMLEMIFHTRMQKYRCLTKNASEADAFFVPYYTGLLALDLLYDQADAAITYEARKNFGQEILDWLKKNGGEHWSRFGGADHFMLLGRTSWDFSVHPHWGTGFSELPYFSNMTSLLLERREERTFEIAIPYPTGFHPSSPRKLQSWIEKVKSSKRKYLFSYVGAPRSESWSVRGIIGNACIDAGESVCNLVNCSIVKCSHDPVPIYESFLSSTFCLQPKGDTATRRSTFDCLIAGAIPVFFDNATAYTQYPWHLPPDPESYSVFIPEDDLKKGASIEDILASYTPQQIAELRQTVVALIPNLLYNGYDNDSSGLTQDAYEITVERVLERIAGIRRELTAKPRKWWMAFRPMWFIE